MRGIQYQDNIIIRFEVLMYPFLLILLRAVCSLLSVKYDAMEMLLLLFSCYYYYYMATLHAHVVQGTNSATVWDSTAVDRTERNRMANLFSE